MAEVKVLIPGYTTADSKNVKEKEKTCATISLVKDKDLVMVVDPGVLKSQDLLVKALNKEGLGIDDVNIVCITHSHFGEINSNFKVGDKMFTEFIFPSSPPKKSSGFLGPKKSSERFLRNPRQTTHVRNFSENF